MEEKKASDHFGITFEPDRWSPLDRFLRLYGPPFVGNRDVYKGASSVAHHLRKFDVIGGLVNVLHPRLAEDREQLKEMGHTPASRSKEYAALVETLYCELYAMLDGVRRLVFGAYGPKGAKVRGVQSDSTEKLFSQAANGKYGPEFPTALHVALSSAYSSWFPALRRIRTEVTHGEVGSCHQADSDSPVFYSHSALGVGSKSLIIEDVVGDLNEKRGHVTTFVETVFRHFCTLLVPNEQDAICGFYKARVYQRRILTTPDLNFHSGRCISYKWFEKEPGLECPLRAGCGAYQRSKSEDAETRTSNDTPLNTAPDTALTPQPEEGPEPGTSQA